MKNLRVYKSFLDIVLKNRINYEENRMLLVPQSKTFTLALDFLGYEDKYYEQAFRSLLENRKVKLRKKHINSSDNLQIIKTNTLDDTFNLMNAFSAYMNSRNYTNETIFFNRTLPMLLELRLYEYLKNTDISKEAKKQIKNILFENYKMIKNYKELVNIDSDKFFKYLFGTVMSIYINSNIETGNISKNEYLYLSHNINDIPLRTLNDILSLDMCVNETGIDMSNESLEKLEKTYKKEIMNYER